MAYYLSIALCLLTLGPLYGQLVGDHQNGIGSYYSSEYDGAETAYGEIYRSGEMVAAHKTFPYNSRVQVRNQANGRTAVVRIIDKGPFIRGRIIELSQRAARELRMLGERTVPVELTLLSTPDQPASFVDEEPTPAFQAPPVVTQPERAVVVDVPTTRPTVETPPPPPPPAREPAVKRTPPPAVPARFQTGTYRVSLDPVDEGRYAVQVGSFLKLERALDKVAELSGRYFDDILLDRGTVEGTERFRVLLGPFPDRPSAAHYTSSLKTRYGLDGFPVRLHSE